MSKAPKIAAVLMASGFGKRFGSNKLLADYNGRPLIETVLDNLPAERFFRVAVVTRYAEIAVAAAERRFSIVENDREDDPAETIRLGVEALPAGVDGALFLVCDQPRLRPETICALCDAFFRTPERIVAPVCEGARRNPVIFPRSLFPDLASLPPGKGGGYVVERRRALLETVEFHCPEEFFDADTPEALAKLKNMP